MAGPSHIHRKENPKGKPAASWQVYQTLPQEGTKSANAALRDSMCGPDSCSMLITEDVHKYRRRIWQKMTI